MTEFWALLGQIFIITIAQSLLNKIIGKNADWAEPVLSILCYAAGLYLTLKFIFDNYVPEFYDMFTQAFPSTL